MIYMIIIGLTGGSGSGKGYVAGMFAARGIPALDTDMVSRLVCAPGSDCLRELAGHFGGGIIKTDGTLDRAALAALAFSEKENMAALNSITHRHILAYCRKWLDERREAGCAAAIIDAPQLYESGFDAKCSAVVAVVADEALRLKRILARDGITLSQAKLRLQRQRDDDFFRAHADYIIENNFDENHPDNGELLTQVDAVLHALGLAGDKP